MRDYLVACGESIEALRNEVMILVQHGYLPQGGIAIEIITIEEDSVKQEITYYQAMYRNTRG